MFPNTYQPYISQSVQDRTEKDVNTYLSNVVRKPYGPESGMAIPHVLSMSSIVGTAYRTYWMGRYDEALRDSQENADAMRNDPFVRRLIDERKHAVCSLKMSVEVDNERDPWQKAVKDSLMQQWKSIPRPYDLNWYLNEAIFYGRYGSQFSWKFKTMDLPAMPKVGGIQPGLPMILGAPGGREKRKVLCMTNHIPYEGDKIGYDYDGCPYVLISSMAACKLAEHGADVGNIPDIQAKSMEYGYTTAGGKALFLRTPSWRQRFAIHTGEVLDGPFLDAEKGDQIHGIGLRSVMYWYWWLRDEFLSNVSDWCSRTGLGIRLWYYDASNPASEAAIDRAARDQSDKVNIKIPRQPGSEATEGVEMVETAGTGADLLLRMVQHVEEHLTLYATGQNMSTGAQENSGSGFGDRGRADFAQSTKYQITKRDAAKFGDTCTDDILSVMKQWSLPPELQEIPARLVCHTDTPDPQRFMEAVKTFVEIGGNVQENQVRSTLGLADVGDGDKVLGGSGLPGAGQGEPGKPGQPGAPKPNESNGKPEPHTTGVAGEHVNGKPAMNGKAPAHDRFEMPKKTDDQKYQEYKKLIRDMRRNRHV